MLGRILRLQSSSSSQRSPRAVAFFLAAAVPFAYHICEYPVTESSPLDATPPLADNERACKKWELTRGVYAINSVKIDLPGLTFIQHEPTMDTTNAHLATVIVSGDSQAIVECVDVIQLPPNGVKLRFKSKECADLRGHLLTAVALGSTQQVNQVQTSGGGTTVVEDGVLVSDCTHASVDLSVQGSGSLHILATEHDINLSRLKLSLVGRGKLRFAGPASVNVRDQMLLEVAGSGSLHSSMGKLSASLLKSSLAGPGTVLVKARDGFEVGKVKTSIADTGDGRVSYVGDGHCRIQRCSVVGSGKMEARGIHCDIASTDVAVGHADVTMQVAAKMNTSGWGSTTLRYVGQPPHSIEGKSISLRPAPAASVDSEALKMDPVPTPKDAFNQIEAVYEPLVVSTDNSSGVGSAARFLVNTFLGAEITRSKKSEAQGAPKSTTSAVDK